MTDPRSTFDAAHDALNRMRRAAVRGTGCHLTAAMIESLSRTMLGETWCEPDPRMDKDKDKLVELERAKEAGRRYDDMNRSQRRKQDALDRAALRSHAQKEG